MLSSKVAKRYALGLLDYSQENGSTEQIFSEMKDVVKIMNDSRDLNVFFATPFIDAKKKEGAVSEIFKDFTETSKNFIKLVVKQGRESGLKEIASSYINMVEDMRGVQRVTLKSAAPLSQNNVEEILKASNLVDLSKGYDLKMVTEPELIGGYVLRAGDRQIDASIRTKLNNLRKNFQLN